MIRIRTLLLRRRISRGELLAVLTNAHLPAPIRFESSGSDAAANQGPPTLVWRVLAALCYLVPWIDSISFGREMYRRFRNLLVLYLVPGPLAKVYFSSQFAPLIIFFVLFLAVVKNKKLHHFVRFNCMQAIMLDIVIMLCHIVKAYLPAEIKWSVIAHLVGIDCRGKDDAGRTTREGCGTRRRSLYDLLTHSLALVRSSGGYGHVDDVYGDGGVCGVLDAEGVLRGHSVRVRERLSPGCFERVCVVYTGCNRFG